MSKFKVGDRVRIVEGMCPGHQMGDLGRITKLGYQYGFYTYDYRVDVDGREGPYDEDEIAPATNTLDDLAKGDVVINYDGDERTILARIEDALLMGAWYDQHQAGSWYTIHELTQGGWKLKQPEPAPEVQELTVAEIEEKLGVQSGALRIKKDA